jgi:hypothetical protein
MHVDQYMCILTFMVCMYICMHALDHVHGMCALTMYACMSRIMDFDHACSSVYMHTHIHGMYLYMYACTGQRTNFKYIFSPCTAG